MSDQGAGSAADSRPKVEIGWVIEADLTDELREAAKSTATRLESFLQECMPMFTWILDTLERPLERGDGRAEPVQLLDAVEIDRDAHGWDFAFVLTGRKLHGREKAQVLGMTSGIFSTALISTAFLNSRAAPERRAPAQRLHALAMHLFARLNGLSPDRSDTFLGSVTAPEDLDRMDGLDAAAVGELTAKMRDVADLRAEELLAPDHGSFGFYVRSIWLNRGTLPDAILRMRPWVLPLRLPRLTTAAGSALAVLLMTAESWEVAANLSGPAILVLSLLALAATSTYLLKAQRLLASRQGPLREQRAVTNAGTVLAVVLGMGVTYLGVFAIAYLLAIGLFGSDLLERWVGEQALPSVRLSISGLVASLSLIIGALGASFEPYGYFRHVTQIDDEI
ncbi:hypothetical protein [Hoeflea sp.]|uniref:hypothetical protein n=1 Tax=Hoeflea sp. TaxID=1940281 RepID=UPI003BAE9622